MRKTVIFHVRVSKIKKKKLYFDLSTGLFGKTVNSTRDVKGGSDSDIAEYTSIQEKSGACIGPEKSFVQLRSV